MQVRPRDRFAAEVHLTPATVSAFAQRGGSESCAPSSRTSNDTLSATHCEWGTTGLLMGLTATHFSQDTAMVGLEFWFRFRRPIFDETIRLEWLVIAVRPNARLGGNIVDLRGRIRNQVGETAVGAKGRVLVAERL